MNIAIIEWSWRTGGGEERKLQTAELLRAVVGCQDARRQGLEVVAGPGGPSGLKAKTGAGAVAAGLLTS